MKANKQSKIKVPKSGYKRSKFNLSHDVNSTFSFGEIQPVGCRMLQPGSKTTVSTQSLIRLAPLVAPTFGRIKYKTFNQFVDVMDIFPNYDAMMAQQPVNRNGRTKVPQKLPCVKLGQLSSWCYQGAKATLYWVDEATHVSNVMRAAAAENGEYVTWFKPNVGANTIPSNVSTMLSAAYGIGKPFSTEFSNAVYSNIPGAPKLYPDWLGAGNTGYYLILRPKTAISDSWNSAYTGDTTYGSEDYIICLSNNAVTPTGVLHSLLPYNPAVLADAIVNNPAAAYVSMSSADSLIEFKVVDHDAGGNDVEHYYCLALEFSDYGKRLRKIFQGCGYQIDIGSDEDVSILPLLAQYKAYFDIFGLQLYQGWETTYCAKLIDYIKNNFIETIDFERYGGQASDAIRIASMPYNTSNPNYNLDVFTSFCSFMFAEVAQEWYTDDPDWIGSHMSKLAVSPSGPESGHSGGMITVDSNGIDLDTVHVTNRDANYAGNGIDYGQLDSNSDSALVGYSSDSAVHAYITQLEHSQVDADLLKRLYKWTNRNSVLGREIAKLLRAQGLGTYVDECKSNYIGATDNMITISDVVSMADTDNGQGQGAVLGEYGGKGLQYIEDKTLVFENDSLGYWVTLACIVPEAGYVQGLDPTLTALDKFSLYNPDFDALGMELTKKSVLVGCNYDVKSVNSVHGVASRLGFGFTPRYSKFKVAGNIVNGDFNRHALRNTYLPYTLDKQLYVNDFDTSVEKLVTLSNGDVIGTLILKRSLVPETLPVAGNIWRTPTKYPWLGHFNRIFMNVGDRRSTDINDAGMYHGGDSAIGFTDFNSDNFLMHSIVGMTTYAPMKPIEESYGLEDDEPQTVGVEFTQKA